jgi:dihydropteroate synthase type 2
MAAPRIFGIVNLTEDSFSDGGRYLEPARALAHARQLISDGAWAVDLGPASSHPEAREVPPAEEIQRLAPVVEALHRDGARLSVDSFRSETQSWALASGVAWLNDIQGFPDSALYPELASSGAQLILMHSIQRRGIATRAATDPLDVWNGMLAFFDARLEALVRAGIKPERVVLDPGMGFFLGANPQTSLHVLRNLPELRARFGRELLVSVSRKSFLGVLTGRETSERGSVTLAAELHAARCGVDYVRTHDVRALADALRVASALAQSAHAGDSSERGRD